MAKATPQSGKPRDSVWQKLQLPMESAKIMCGTPMRARGAQGRAAKPAPPPSGKELKKQRESVEYKLHLSEEKIGTRCV